MPSLSKFAFVLTAGLVAAAPTKSVWQPTPGTTWQIMLSEVCQASMTQDVNAVAWDVDLYDTPTSTIAALQAAGKKVICYFSAGSYEPGRPDSSKFQSGDLGSVMDGWPDEKWLNINSANVRSIMTARIQLAAKNGCDAIDPDNVDGYDNSNGLGLTEQNAVDFVNFMADTAAANGLAMGLKNAGGIIPKVISKIQFSVNEQCHEYSECDTYQPFIQANKPVFNIEYPGSISGYSAAPAGNSKCNSAATNSAGFSTVLKNMALDAAVQECPASPGYTGVNPSSSPAPSSKPASSATPKPSTTSLPGYSAPAPSNSAAPHTSAAPLPSYSAPAAPKPQPSQSSYGSSAPTPASSKTPSSPSKTAVPTGIYPPAGSAPTGTAPASPTASSQSNGHKHGHKGKGKGKGKGHGTKTAATPSATVSPDAADSDDCRIEYVEVYDL